MSKISCCMIVRDERLTIETLLRQIRPHVDEIVIVDTGSTDGTYEICKAIADKCEVYTECNDEQGLIYDFAKARNRSLELASHDWVIWFDGDDEVKRPENIRRLTERTPAAKAAVYMVPYEYDHDAEGNCTTLQLRERLVWPRKRFTWNYPIHELLLPSPDLLDEDREHVYTHDFLVVHKHPAQKQRDNMRNLRLLEKWHKQVGDHNLRCLFYLGGEYAKHGRQGESLRCLRKYVERSDWADEKCLAELLIARIYLDRGDAEEAIRWADQAKNTKSWSAPWFIISRAYFLRAIQGVDDQANFRRSIMFAKHGLESPPEQTVLFFNPAERFEIHETLSVALAAIGDFENALASCEEGLRHLPNNEVIRANRDKFKMVLAKRKVKSAMQELVDGGHASVAAAQCVDAILSSTGNQMPPGLEESQAGQQKMLPPAQKLVVRGTEGRLGIVFYVGHQLEPWNPQTLDRTGMGGSETMAWLLAKRLAAKGHTVHVFGHCTPELEGTFDGVKWEDASKCEDLECDVFISSRKVEALDNPNIRADLSILWVHDVHVGPLTRKRDLRWDMYLTLSQWHHDFFLEYYRETLPQDIRVPIDPSKVRITRNGIELERFSGTPAGIRNDHVAVYSSSPDRGLAIALANWSKVREKVPDAELRIFYGFDNWETTARLMVDQNQLNIIAQYKEMIGKTPGAKLVGRVPRDELAQEFLAAGVWAYPTVFTETSCITAAEAQAAGLYTVSTKLAALPETVGPGASVLIDAPAETPEYQAAWVEEVVSAMLNSDPEERYRASKWAEEHFSIDTLADEWDEMLTSAHEDLLEQVVPKYQPAPEGL